jgi:protein-glutamine gamma-glutamyltransferase
LDRAKPVNFESFFRFISYLAAFCGFLSLWVSGSFGMLGAGLFIAVIIAAWFLEGGKWQISERLGTALIVLALPLYYLASRLQIVGFSGGAAQIAGTLGRLIITLTAIKLLQKKSDRDWIFLYLMAFFEVLLAAGLSISATYLASLVLYLLVMVCAAIAFEMRKTSRNVISRTHGMIKRGESEFDQESVPSRRLPALAAGLIILIVCLGLPLFFFLPRVGSAGLGGRENGVATRTGFSDIVRLGGIGTLQQNDEIVMRVRVNGVSGEQPGLYWRGLALDTFDGKAWGRSNTVKEAYAKGERDVIPIDLATDRNNIVEQTIYLEPLDTPVLFGLPKIVGIRSGLPLIYKDTDGGISSSRSSERISYHVWSDRATPTAEVLRDDDQRYPRTSDRYLGLPEKLDPRIVQLAESITAGKSNRYDKARAIEQYLQTQFGYTLEMKAGGDDPLADFLFNVREGHCEYFATAMAIMLRTQGIATRVVNGFHQGEYNDTADIYVVRQKNAHSWVEVEFSNQEAWVKFDPTPPGGQVAPASTAGITRQINKYIEALEAYWIQYFVAYDNREQRSLARSVRSGLSDYQQNLSGYLSRAQAFVKSWWTEVRGDFGSGQSVAAVGKAVGLVTLLVAAGLLISWLARDIVKLKVWGSIADRFRRRRPASIVEFYDRMLKVLASKGYIRQPHQTPLEFANAVGMSEAVSVTEKYNRVRFGEKYLSESEESEIESWMTQLISANENELSRK